MYLQHFSSDRSHMYDSKTQTWNAPPPSYKCIMGATSTEEESSQSERKTENTNTLKHYMIISDRDLDESREEKSRDGIYGRIYSLPELMQQFSV